MSKRRKLTEKEDNNSISLTKKMKAPDSVPGRASILGHEGSKYLRAILSAHSNPDETRAIEVDVYCVLEAFEVTCPATQHAIKKLLAAGLRAKGDRLADLIGAMAALNRAIDMEKQRIQT